MSHTHIGMRVAGGWLAIASLLLAGGIVLHGPIDPDMRQQMQVVADGFVRLLQMTVLPYVTISIISSLGSLNLQQARLLGLRCGLVVLALWAIAFAVTWLMPLTWPDTESASFFSTTLIAQPIEPAWKRDPLEGQRRVDRLLELSQTALREMRSLLFELRPRLAQRAAARNHDRAPVEAHVREHVLDPLSATDQRALARIAAKLRTRPVDLAVSLREAPARTVAALRFSGTWSPERFAERERELLARIAASRWRGFTAGSEGIPVPFRPGFWTLGLGHVAWVYLALVIAVLFYGLQVFLERSRVGYQLAGVREDEDAAEALGIASRRLKMYAVTLSAALTSVCGSLWAQYVGFVDPFYVFSVDLSVRFALASISSTSASRRPTSASRNWRRDRRIADASAADGACGGSAPRCSSAPWRTSSGSSPASAPMDFSPWKWNCPPTRSTRAVSRCPPSIDASLARSTPPRASWKPA